MCEQLENTFTSKQEYILGNDSKLVSIYQYLVSISYQCYINCFEATTLFNNLSNTTMSFGSLGSSEKKDLCKTLRCGGVHKTLQNRWYYS